jgi:hypothetical protein
MHLVYSPKHLQHHMLHFSLIPYIVSVKEILKNEGAHYILNAADENELSCVGMNCQ